MEAHDDNATTNIVKGSFEFLRTLGYSKICIEIDQNDSLDSLIDNYERLRRDPDAENRKQGEKYFDFYTQIKQNAAWLAFQGIDFNLGNRRSSKKLLREAVANKEFNEARETEFATKVITSANQADGGVIVIIGLGHGPNLQNRLMRLGNTQGNDYMFLAAFSELNSCVEQLRAESRFPLGRMTLDLTHENSNDVLKQFQEAVLNRIPAVPLDAPLAQYVHYMNNSPTKEFTELKNRLNLPLTLARDAHGNIDAMLALNSNQQKNLGELINDICSKIELIVDLKVVRDENHNFYLVIPGLNRISGNEKAVEEATTRREMIFQACMKADNARRKRMLEAQSSTTTATIPTAATVAAAAETRTSNAARATGS